MEEIRKTMKNLGQDSLAKGQELNLVPPECEAEILFNQYTVQAVVACIFIVLFVFLGLYM